MTRMRTLVFLCLAAGCAGSQKQNVHFANEDYDLSACTNIGLVTGKAPKGAGAEEKARWDVADQAAKMGGTTVRITSDQTQGEERVTEAQVFKCPAQ